MYGKMNFNVFYFKCEFGSRIYVLIFHNNTLAQIITNVFFILIVMTNLLVKTVQSWREEKEEKTTL